MTGLTQSSIRNQLLTCLSADDFAFLAPHLQQVELAARSSIHSAGQAITNVFFPERGYASMLAALDDGDTAEVGMIGSEGMIGLPLVFSALTAPWWRQWCRAVALLFGWLRTFSSARSKRGPLSGRSCFDMQWRSISR